MNLNLEGTITKKQAMVIVGVQAAANIVVTLRGIKELNRTWKKVVDDRNQVVAILQETTNFLLDRADDETHRELNKNLDYWRIIRGIDPPTTVETEGGE